MPDGQIIKPDIRDAERLQGLPTDWTIAAPERLRWSLVGNAVSVPVAAWLGRRLVEPGFYFGDLDSAWQVKRGGFPRAARFDGKKRYVVNVGAFPVWTKRQPLHSFLRHQGVPLSPRATAGFLSRAESSSLRFVPGFLDAVRTHFDRMQTTHSRLADSNPCDRNASRIRKLDRPKLSAAQ